MSSQPATDLHYRVDGPAGAPVMVLSHALGASMRMWELQLPALASSYRVVRYDQRGHGASPMPPGPYTIEALGRDLVRLLDQLELERVSLCGLSLGGMVGMWIGINAPERLDRLILCCTAARMMRPDDYAVRARKVQEEGMASIADGVVGRWLTPAFATDHPETVAWMRDMLLATPPEGYAATCEALQSMDLRSALSRIEAATLVIAASEDQSTPVDQAREIAASIRRSKLAIISGAAHLANVERPQEVTEQLLSILSSKA